MNQNDRDQLLGFVQGFLLGGLIGAGVALLYAPQSGKETREDLRRKSREFKDEAERQYQQALDRAIYAKERAEEQIDTLMKQGRERANNWRERARKPHKRPMDDGETVPSPEQSTAAEA